MFPTGDFLRSHNIVPSNKTMYTLQQLQDAVKAHTGVVPYFGCAGPEAPEGDGRTVLDEVKQLYPPGDLILTYFLGRYGTSTMPWEQRRREGSYTLTPRRHLPARRKERSGTMRELQAPYATIR
jgi:hypothetical protein